MPAFCAPMSLLFHLQEVEDPRSHINKKHDLVEVIFLAFSAVLSGADGWKSIEEFGDYHLQWLRKHSPFKNGIPRRHCISKIICALDPDVLAQAVLGWINQERERTGCSVIAIDGKTLKKAWQGKAHKALHVVSALDTQLGISLYQNATDNKGHEIEQAREVINKLALSNRIVTMDSLHCQKETLTQIVERKGDFVVQLKANQPNLHKAVQQAFADRYESQEDLAEFTQENKGHGRVEKRHVMQLHAKHLPEEMKTQWPEVKSVIEISSERTLKGKTSCDSRWYISSLELDAQQAADCIRSHWSVENKLHWVLDVVFREDDLVVRDPTGAAHFALFNRVALGILKQHQAKKKESIASKRRQAMWSSDLRTELIFGVDEKSEA